MAVILKELNTNYPYVLINDCTIIDSGGTAFCPGWSTDTSAGGTFKYITSVCPTTTTPPQTLFSKLSALSLLKSVCGGVVVVGQTEVMYLKVPPADVSVDHPGQKAVPPESMIVQSLIRT